MLNECRKALEKYPGDIVEIGAGLGETTKHLLTLAKEFNRKVVVIDPFENGWSEMPESYGKPYPLEKFHANVKDNKDRLVIYQINSLSEDAEHFLSIMEIAFAFIDGLQYKGAVLNDLRITNHAGVVCLDDVDRYTKDSQVVPAITEYLKTSNKTLTTNDRWAFLE